MRIPWFTTGLWLYVAAAVLAAESSAQGGSRPWLWKAPARQPVPDAAGSTDIDRFLGRRLAQEGLHAAPPTDDRTWLRRASYVVTGLPPRPEDVEAFLKDASPGRHGIALDRLLASPAFGERWARHWLDLVRYAETRGHEDDYRIANAWHYRDYLVRAFNADVPYDRVVAEHVAGDLVEPRARPENGANESVLATGWAFLGEEVHSPVDIRQDECDRMDNKLDVLTKTFLGLTVACARCHDHKFDPIRQRDYYALAGVIRGAAYRQVRFDTDLVHAQAARTLATMRTQATGDIERELAAGMAGLPDRLRDALAAGKAPQPHDAQAWDAEMEAASKNPLHPLHRVAVVTRGGPAGDVPTPRPWPPSAPDVVVADFTRASLTPWRTDGPGMGAGVVEAGRLVPGTARVADVGGARRDRFWDAMRVVAGNEADPGSLAATERSGRTLRTPSFKLASGKVHYLLRGKARVYAAVDSHLLIAGPLHGGLVARWDSGTGARWVTHDLSAYVGHRLHVEFAPDGDASLEVFAVVDSPASPQSMPFPAWSPGAGQGTREGLAKAMGDALAEGVRLLGAGRLAMRPDLAPLVEWARSHAAMLGGMEPSSASAVALAARERTLAASLPWESRTAVAWWEGDGVDEDLLVRGKPTRAAGPVERAVPAVFGKVSLGDAGRSGRMDLVGWLMDPGHPLVARVAVNRAWQHVFGAGIVGTPDNFGELGEPPSHPELLDHLAWQFVHVDRWSMKSLVRRLVLTDAFARSSRNPDPRAEEKDPRNRWLHRMPVRRLEAEAIRDALLAVSGRIQHGAPARSVMVHLPDYVDGRARPSSGPLDGDGRRSVYLSIRRNFLPQILVAFDYPTPFSTVGRRNSSNVPAQSLAMMNDPFVHDQARQWSRRMLSEQPGLDDAGRVAWLYEHALSRPPRDDEQRACREALADLRSVGGGRPESEVWQDIAHALLTTAEFIHIR
ncbi:MAG: DUF1549 and DUF1553 domain-containing protein [Verrucomicrobiota bacterium]|jgi:hypothetical protein